MYIQHLTLSTGHARRIEAGEVSGEVLARVSPWLAALAESGGHMPLPVAGLAEYTGLATVVDGALIVTISGPPDAAGRAPPLVSMGVARRSRHGAALWPLLTGPVMPPTAPGLRKPDAPWCGVALWPTLALYPQATEWLGDLERCIAWAWCTAVAD